MAYNFSLLLYKYQNLFGLYIQYFRKFRIGIFMDGIILAGNLLVQVVLLKNLWLDFFGRKLFDPDSNYIVCL